MSLNILHIEKRFKLSWISLCDTYFLRDAVEQSSLHQDHSAQTDYNWTPLAAFTFWPWVTTWLGFSSVARHAPKILQYIPCFCDLLHLATSVGASGERRAQWRGSSARPPLILVWKYNFKESHNLCKLTASFSTKNAHRSACEIKFNKKIYCAWSLVISIKQYVKLTASQIWTWVQFLLCVP